MNKYKFVLAAAYSRFKRVFVAFQNGAMVVFVTDCFLNEDLTLKLDGCFRRFVDYVRSKDDCPEEFCNEVKIVFIRVPSLKRNRLKLGLFKKRYYEKTVKNSNRI